MFTLRARPARRNRSGFTLIELLVVIAIIAIDRSGTVSRTFRNCRRQALLADKVVLGKRIGWLDMIQQLRSRGDGSKKPRKADPGTMDWKSVIEMGERVFNHMAAALKLSDRAARLRAFDHIEMELEKQFKSAKKVVSEIPPFFDPDELADPHTGAAMIVVIVPRSHSSTSRPRRATCSTASGPTARTAEAAPARTTRPVTTSWCACRCRQ